MDSSADSPPSLKARTHSVSTGGSPVGAGGVGGAVRQRWSHQPPGQRALSPLLAPSRAQEGCWAQAPEQGPCAHGCPVLVTVAGSPALRPVPAVAVGWVRWGCHCWAPTELSCLPHRRTLPHDGAQCRPGRAPASLEGPGEAAACRAPGLQLRPAPALLHPGRAQWAAGAGGPGGLEQQPAAAGQERASRAAAEGQPQWGGGCWQPPAHPTQHRR